MVIQNIGFIGLGKLGMDCAEVFAGTHQVRGFDIYPRSSSLVQVCDIHTVINHSDWIFIAVPTPHAPGYDGSKPSSDLEPRDFDYHAVKDAISQINHLAQTPKRVVVISTVLPGTVRAQLAPLLDAAHQLVYNPYLIAMGSVKWDMVNPEMVIIGTRHGGTDQVVSELIQLYQSIMTNDTRYEVGTWEECEAIKIFYNTFVSTKIGLANMIQDFAMRIGNINVDVVTDALAKSTQRIMAPKYMTAGMGDAGACHPRDNIALRWLAQEYDLGYDLFDTVMRAREQQARNLANHLVSQRLTQDMQIVIHGKAYKPDVPYCVGSYSTLVGHYVQEAGHQVSYVDPLADDRTACVDEILEPAVILMAHNRHVTYGYTGQHSRDQFYCEIPIGSIVVDPWRKIRDVPGSWVVHYGNTREK